MALKNLCNMTAQTTPTTHRVPCSPPALPFGGRGYRYISHEPEYSSAHEVIPFGHVQGPFRTGEQNVKVRMQRILLYWFHPLVTAHAEKGYQRFLRSMQYLLREWWLPSSSIRNQPLPHACFIKGALLDPVGKAKKPRENLLSDPYSLLGRQERCWDPISKRRPGWMVSVDTRADSVRETFQELFIWY